MPRDAHSPDFPPQRFTARYELGFVTDCERLDIDEKAWDFVYQSVENFILCNPYLASWEIADSGGARFLVTEDVPFLNVPSLIVYFMPDEDTRRVAFLTVEEVPQTPDSVDFDDF